MRRAIPSGSGEALRDRVSCARGRGDDEKGGRLSRFGDGKLESLNHWLRIITLRRILLEWPI